MSDYLFSSPDLEFESEQVKKAGAQILDHDALNSHLTPQQKELVTCGMSAVHNTEYAFNALKYAIEAALGDKPKYDLIVDSVIRASDTIAKRYGAEDGSALILHYVEHLQHHLGGQFTYDSINRDSFAHYAASRVKERSYTLVADFQAQISSALIEDAKAIMIKTKQALNL